MEKNATSQPPAEQQLPSRSRYSRLPLAIVAFVLATSILASGLYFYYSRVYKPNIDSENLIQGITDSITRPNWQEFTYPEAQIRFMYPTDFSAVEIDNGLSILQDGETVMQIKHGRLNGESLSEVVETLASAQTDIKTVNQKAGLTFQDETAEYMYFPLFGDEYVVFERYNIDNETSDLVNQVVESITFLPPEL